MPFGPFKTRGRLVRAVMTMAFAGWAVQALPRSGSSTDLVYVGMHGSEIRAGRFDPKTGALMMIGPVASVPRPTWTIRHPRLPVLYAVNQEGNDGLKDGSIFAFAIDPKTGALTKLNEVDAGGGGTTYLSFDRRSNTLIAANYAGGSVSTFPIFKDGRIGAAVSVVAASGSGPHRRQARPHAHSVAVDPSGRFVLVADLGADRLFVYPFDGQHHVLHPDAYGQERHYAAAPCSGPRHFAFHPGGHFLYLLNELTAEIQAFRWDAGLGRLTLLQSQTTDGPGHQGDSSASEILVSRDGRFVYAGNRGENNILVYAVDRTNGTLSLVQRIASGGMLPWSFSLHPSGHWLLVANEKSDLITIFAVDPHSGKLSDSGQSVASPKPVSVTFYP